MRIQLEKLVEEFGKNLTKHEYNQYIPKIRDYFVEYLLKTHSGIKDADEFLTHLITRQDIILATVYYVENNEFVKSKTAISDFLIAVNQFYEICIAKKYHHVTIESSRPFSTLFSNVEEILSQKSIILEDRQKISSHKGNSSSNHN